MYSEISKHIYLICMTLVCLGKWICSPCKRRISRQTSKSSTKKGKAEFYFVTKYHTLCTFLIRVQEFIYT